MHPARLPASDTRMARSFAHGRRAGDGAGAWDLSPRTSWECEPSSLGATQARMDDRADYQHRLQWDGARAPASCRASRGDTSTSVRAEEGLLYAETNEMVAGRLSPHEFDDDPVQPQAGPSTPRSDLYLYTHDPRNLVIDSIDSDVPHIVITRPEPMWDEMYVCVQNRVEYQWPGFLNVPERERGYTSMGRHPLDIPPSESVMCWSDLSPPRTRRRRRLPLTFNRAHFNDLIDYAVWDRESYPNIVATLLRRFYILSVAAAVDEAESWRQTYDDPAWNIEQPFRWVDPAEAVLPSLRAYRGTTVLDSITPLRTPHIVINEPPPLNPWVAYFNIPSDPQDAAFGARLTVPWPRVINEPYAGPDIHMWDVDESEVAIDDELWASDDMAVDVTTAESLDIIGESDSEQDMECEDDDSDSSRPESPGPDTPLDSPPLSLAVALDIATSKNKEAWLAVPGVHRRPRQLSL